MTIEPLTPADIVLCLDSLQSWRAQYADRNYDLSDVEALEAKLQAALAPKLDAMIDDMTEDDT